MNPSYSLLESVTFLVASRNKLTFDHKHAFFLELLSETIVSCCVLRWFNIERFEIRQYILLFSLFRYYRPIEMVWNPPFEHI